MANGISNSSQLGDILGHLNSMESIFLQALNDVSYLDLDSNFENIISTGKTRLKNVATKVYNEESQDILYENLDEFYTDIKSLKINDFNHVDEPCKQVVIDFLNQLYEDSGDLEAPYDIYKYLFSRAALEILTFLKEEVSDERFDSELAEYYVYIGELIAKIRFADNIGSEWFRDDIHSKESGQYQKTRRYGMKNRYYRKAVKEAETLLSKGNKIIRCNMASQLTIKYNNKLEQNIAKRFTNIKSKYGPNATIQSVFDANMLNEETLRNKLALLYFKRGLK
jgi:hypothetical protein